nr:unnamed protein product [Digitaria exilis]
MKEANLNGEGIAEEVGESSNCREHGALHELPRPGESLPQVLRGIITPVPPLLLFLKHRSDANRSPPPRRTDEVIGLLSPAEEAMDNWEAAGGSGGGREEKRRACLVAAARPVVAGKRRGTKGEGIEMRWKGATRQRAATR